MGERVRKAEVARMLAVSPRTVLDMARAGRLPGACQVGSIWTFDPNKVRAFIARQEAKALCPQTSFSAAASGMPGFTRAVVNDESAYARAISRKPAKGSKAQKRSSSAAASG